MTRRSIVLKLVVLAAGFAAASASAAYFHETRRDGALWVSDLALKQKFVVEQSISQTMLPSPEASQIENLPPTPGLYEQEGGVRIPNGRCEGDDDAVHACERKWEATNLAKAKAAASRRGDTLTLSPQAGAKLVLTDWEKCTPEGECDGERFVYLGALPRSGALAVEIDYSHDSPSLVLVDPKSGKLAAVHYGSEPSFLNPAQTLLVSSEDMNDATTLLVTRLDGSGPAIDVQCRGARTEASSFGVTFKRWISDAGFEVVLLRAGESIPTRFELGADGNWTARTQVHLKNEGFECRQRGAPPAPPAAAATPPRSS